MARKASSRIKFCAMARFFGVFGRLWDPLGTILARGNPSPEALTAVSTFESIDLDGPEALWMLSHNFLAQNWMLSHDFLAQNWEICVNFCVFRRAGILADLEFWGLPGAWVCLSFPGFFLR